MQGVIRWGGLAFTVLFLGTWLYLSWEVWFTDSDGPVKLGSNMVTAAGFIATTVATQTAAWLGIEIADVRSKRAIRAALGQDLSGTDESPGTTVKRTLTKLSVPAFSAWSYMIVAVLVIIVCVAKQANVPDVYQAFMFSGIGWLAGCFAVGKEPE